jgi:hypothetical protein
MTARMYFFGRRIEARENEGDVIDDVGVFVVACAAVLFGRAFKLCGHFRVGNFFGDGIHVLLCGEETFDLFLVNAICFTGGEVAWSCAVAPSADITKSETARQAI